MNGGEDLRLPQREMGETLGESSRPLIKQAYYLSSSIYYALIFMSPDELIHKCSQFFLCHASHISSVSFILLYYSLRPRHLTLDLLCYTPNSSSTSVSSLIKAAHHFWDNHLILQLPKTFQCLPLVFRIEFTVLCKRTFVCQLRSVFLFP